MSIRESPGMDRSRLHLVPHDASWSAWYLSESARIGAALGDLALRIDHIGSTAVPGLIAKPIIDIAIVTQDIDGAERCGPRLEPLGYRYRGQHGDDPLRRYLVLDQGIRRIAQVHVWAAESPAWRATLGFRDLLRTRPDVRSDYAREKLRAAQAVGWDKAKYSIEKGSFIEGVLTQEHDRR